MEAFLDKKGVNRVGTGVARGVGGRGSLRAGRPTAAQGSAVGGGVGGGGVGRDGI